MRRLVFQSARNIKHSSNFPKRLVFIRLASLSRNMDSATANEKAASPSDDATKPSNSRTKDADEKTSPELPKLSQAEFRIYNHMSDTMNLYHNHFRHEWKQLYGACEPSQPNGPQNKVSASRLIMQGLGLIHQLTMHHGIEEAHIFPFLAHRMPVFAQHDSKASGLLLQQHREIHAGMDLLEEYLTACKKGEKDLKRDEVKVILDGFGEVLWKHLEEEVWQLGGERMRKYWSLEEMRTMPL